MENTIIKNPTKRAIFIEILMFLAYAFFAVNWIAGSSLTPQILDTYGVSGPMQLVL